MLTSNKIATLMFLVSANSKLAFLQQKWHFHEIKTLCQIEIVIQGMYDLK